MRAVAEGYHTVYDQCAYGAAGMVAHSVGRPAFANPPRTTLWCSMARRHRRHCAWYSNAPRICTSSPSAIRHPPLALRSPHPSYRCTAHVTWAPLLAFLAASPVDWRPVRRCHHLPVHALAGDTESVQTVIIFEPFPGQFICTELILNLFSISCPINYCSNATHEHENFLLQCYNFKCTCWVCGRPCRCLTSSLASVLPFFLIT
jgi:hypothetical protein